MRAAAIQMNSTEDAGRNLATAKRLVRDAASDGARLVVLPEKWPVLGSADALEASREPLDGPTLTAMRALARELEIDLVAGSLVERVDDDPSGRGRNTSVHIGPDGSDRGVYRKLHLFDVEVAGEVYRESDGEAPGDEIVTSQLADGHELGLTVCYDVRFPELHRILTLRGARVIAVPAAFTERTTREQWEVLLRARAMENQVFVVAANQVGEHAPGRASGGRSMIVDAWGRVLDALGDTDEGFAIADLDFADQDAIRERMPILEHRRPHAYDWPVEQAAKP